MKDIKIIVTKKVASVEGTPIIVCGNSDYTLSFTFDDEWSNEQNKVARFSFIKNGLKSFIDMPINDNTCQVPVLIGIGLVRVGVYAGDLKTTTGAKIKCHKSILCDDADTMDEPFKNLYENLKGEIAKANEPITTEKIEDDAVTIDKVANSLVYDLLKVSTSDDIKLVMTQIPSSKRGIVTAFLANKLTEFKEVDTDKEIYSAKTINNIVAELKTEIMGDVDQMIGGIENGSY